MSKWLASLGVTTFVATCGYLAERGRESFLGLRVDDFAFTRFADSFGIFLLDSGRLLIERVAEAPVQFAIVATAGVIVFALLATARRSRRATIAAFALFAAYLLVRGGDLLLRTELPATKIEGVLTRYVTLDRAIPDDSTGQATALRRLVLCLHDRGEKLSCTDVERTGEPLERWYQDLLLSETILVLIAVLLLVVSNRTSRRARLRPWWLVLGRAIVPVALAPTVVTLLMLPDVYAKTLGSTTYPQATISYLNDQNTPTKMNAFVLHRSDTVLSLYENLGGAQYALTELPNSRVLSIRVQPQASSSDVLELHIDKSFQSANQSQVIAETSKVTTKRGSASEM